MIQKYIFFCIFVTFQSIKFPSADNPVGYNLPLTDFSRLLVNSQNLTSLKLIGAGKNGDPIPVLHILAGCRQLKVGEESNLVNFHHMLVVSIDHLWTLASIAE